MAIYGQDLQDLKKQMYEMHGMLAPLGRPGSVFEVPDYASFNRPGLDRLRNISNTLAQRNVSVEELLELSVYGRQMAAEYELHEIPAPKWLPASLRQLSAAIKAAYRTAQEQRLAAAERELEKLRSKEEKRVAKAEEVERLKKELGL